MILGVTPVTAKFNFFSPMSNQDFEQEINKKKSRLLNECRPVDIFMLQTKLITQVGTNNSKT